MAQVTMELRNLLRTNFKLFDFEYQFDDEAFKTKLEEFVTDYYLDYEIGQDTPEIFKHKFKSRWLRIMPYYNDLYNTTLLDYNPLYNSSIKEVFSQLVKGKDDTLTNLHNNGTNNTTFHDVSKNTDHVKDDTTFHEVVGVSGGGTTTSDDDNTITNKGTNNTALTNHSNNKRSDFPQQAIGTTDFLSGEEVVDGSGSNNNTVDLTNHALNGNVSTSEGHSTSTTDSTNGIIKDSVLDLVTDSTNNIVIEDTALNTTIGNNETNSSYEKVISGITGTTYPELIMKHRSTLLRIQDDIIREMKPCFILTY